MTLPRNTFLLLATAVAATGIGGVASAQSGPQTQPGGLFCLADCNRDLVVDSADVGAFLADWGGTQFDFNGNGVTDGADLGLLLAQFGWTAG